MFSSDPPPPKKPNEKGWGLFQSKKKPGGPVSSRRGLPVECRQKIDPLGDVLRFVLEGWRDILGPLFFVQGSAVSGGKPA